MNNREHFKTLSVEVSHNLPYCVVIVEPWAFHVEVPKGNVWKVILYDDNAPQIQRFEIVDNAILLHAFARGFEVVDTAGVVKIGYFDP